MKRRLWRMGFSDHMIETGLNERTQLQLNTNPNHEIGMIATAIYL